MADLNNFSCTGRLTADAVLRTVSTGSQLVDFSIANNTGFGDKQKTLYIKVTLWGKIAQSIHPYLLKGKQVAVSGAIEIQEWTGKDGEAHKTLCMTANEVILLAGVSEPKAVPAPVQEAVF